MTSTFSTSSTLTEYEIIRHLGKGKRKQKMKKKNRKQETITRNNRKNEEENSQNKSCRKSFIQLTIEKNTTINKQHSQSRCNTQ